MIKIKLCGLSRLEDIAAANEICPDYIGFVFAPGSSRYVDFKRARELKRRLDSSIMAVGVFVNEKIDRIVKVVNEGIIEAVQLHGAEDNAYIAELRQRLNGTPVIIQAIRVRTTQDITKAENSAADLILLDAGSGTGTTFDWSIIGAINRPYLLAGGLTVANVGSALERLNPYGVDVSSGIETGGYKDATKMAAFVATVKTVGR